MYKRRTENQRRTEHPDGESAALEPLVRLCCVLCGERIGVYEPLVALVADSARITSRAQEPAIAGDGAVCFHRSCYEQAASGESASSA